MYTAVVITRNPSIVLPAQCLALLMQSLVTAVEQLTDPRTRSLQHVEVVFRIIYTVRVCFEGVRSKTRQACTLPLASLSPFLPCATQM